MDTRQMAQALGSRGGRARAARLPAHERRRIASLGGEARRRSLEAARRIAENFVYARAVAALQGGTPHVRRVKAVRGRLPGLYAHRP